jgi:hypothetical protein
MRVTSPALREVASGLTAFGSHGRATLADELAAAVTALSRDASAEWASVRAAVAAAGEATRAADLLDDSIGELAAELRTAADGYDAADVRASSRRLGLWAGPRAW